MATIDASIIGGIRAPQIENPVDLYAKGLQIQQAQLQGEAARAQMPEAQRMREQEMTLADVYRGATKQDGSVDRNAIYTALAQRGLGGKIPATQKAFLDADKVQSGIKQDEAQARSANSSADKNFQETLLNGLKATDASIASMLADPTIDDRKVSAELGRLVRLGAFDAQAKHMKVTPDQAAKEVMSTMPIGNPGALKQWLLEAGLRTADAAKRLELQLPKYDAQNRGATINQGTINNITGQRTDGSNVQLTASPEAQLSASTARRGQDMVKEAAMDANNVQRTAQRSQIIDTPEGQVIADKGTAGVKPLTYADGTPVMGKDNALVADRKMATNIASGITMARDLLRDSPTASGAGALIDKAAAFTGQSTRGGDKAAALETLAGWLTSNVPRMQGPQGVLDVELYKQMAANVGNRTLPIDTRMAALDTLEQMMNTANKTSGAPVPGGGTPSATNPRPRPAPRNPAAAPGSPPPIDSFFITK